MEYLSNLLQCGNTYRRKTFQTVEIKVRMDCDGCELKVKRALTYMRGVHSVEVNRKLNKVTVKGYVDPNKVLQRVQSTGKRAEIWPYVPFNIVLRPHMVGTYDRRAPPGYVRHVDYLTAQNQFRQEDYTNLFSDENANSCCIM